MVLAVWESHGGLLACVLGPLRQVDVDFVLDFSLVLPWCERHLGSLGGKWGGRKVSCWLGV